MSMPDEIHVISLEFDDRAVTVTFVDPQRDSSVATEITVLQVSPERYSDEIHEIIDDARSLVDRVKVDQRNPPASIRR
jgi:hypothetical protein